MLLNLLFLSQQAVLIFNKSILPSFSISLLYNFYSMLKSKRLPELIVDGFSSDFKKKQPSIQTNQNRGKQQNNQDLLKLLINKNIKANKSAGKQNTKKTSSKDTKSNRSTQFQNNTDQNKSFKNKPCLRLDRIQFEKTQNNDRYKKNDSDRLRIKQKSNEKKFNQNYPSKKARSSSQTQEKSVIGKYVKPRRSSLLNQMINLPNQYQTFEEYYDKNGLNLSTVIKDKMVNVNFLKDKPALEVQSHSLPLKIF